MKLRDFIRDNLTLAEELSQYREFTATIEILSMNVSINNNQLSQTASLKRVQKFILHNGQERIICEEPKTVFFNGPITEQGCGFSYAGNSESRIFTPLNNALNNIEPILDIIPQISSYQSSNSSYISQNASLTSNINSVNQRTTDFQTQVNRLQTQVNSFQISDTIRTFNAKQKAHILQKIWGSGDNDSVNILNAIKQQGFDPHYVHQNGQSLVATALNRNDITLFDLLINNNLDFNNVIAGKTIFEMVLAANKDSLTNKMFTTNKDFSKSVLSIALNNDKVTLNKIFSYKSELSKVSYSGYSLLQLSLKKGSYEVAEEILKVNTDAINQLSSNNLSPIQLCLIWNDNRAIELLKKYGVNIEKELDTAIDKKYVSVINKILEKEPELIKSVVNLESSRITEALLQNSKLLTVKSSTGENLLHLACKSGNYELASKILGSNSSCINHQNDAGKTVFHIILESSLESSIKAQFAELFLRHHPNINLSDSQHHTITDLATENDPNILTMFYEHNLIGDNNS